MKKTLHLATLCGVAVLALLTGGCADVGTGPAYPVGVGYGGFGLYDGPYYGGYGPYYGDSVVVGGYRHAGYYGRHHFYGGGYRGGSYGHFGGINGARATAGRSFGGGRIGGSHIGGGNIGGGHVGGGGIGGVHAGGGGGTHR